MQEKKHLELLMAVALILCSCLLAGEGWERAISSRVTEKTSGYTVVIDAGHGGKDPGKIGVDDSMEKDINLTIAKRLREILEQQDVKVIMTREGDQGLYEEQSSNKKAQDMKNRCALINELARCALINELAPDCAVSIHQNSYHQEGVKGAQVFFYGNSNEAQRLAEGIQRELIRYADPQNHRKAKPNESYYLLRKTEVPIAIVECGFLSNWEEAKKLQEEVYQDRLAWAVAMGILTYLNGA